MKKIKKKYVIFGVLVVVMVGVIVYNILDNRRFLVARQDITISELPEGFDGYRILQISDLYGKYFGEGQEKLLSSINSLEYDCILFTGNMSRYEKGNMSSSNAVLDVLNGLKNKENVLWVDGNTGPFAIETIDGFSTGKVTDMGETIEKAGAKVLTSPLKITKEGEAIWFVPELCQSDFQTNDLSAAKESFGDQEDYEAVLAYRQSLQKWYNELNQNGQVKIRVNHFPVSAGLAQSELESLGYLDYSLSIAGHYRGADVRVSYGTIGPKIWHTPVKGLNQVGNMQQYVSTGLGASGSTFFSTFRVFSTPEINLLTLHCDAE